VKSIVEGGSGDNERRDFKRCRIWLVGRGVEGVSTSVHDPSEVDGRASCGVVGRSEADVDGRSGKAVARSDKSSRGGEDGMIVSSESSRLWT
jgi:hypothetical protein